MTLQAEFEVRKYTSPGKIEAVRVFHGLKPEEDVQEHHFVSAGVEPDEIVKSSAVIENA